MKRFRDKMLEARPEIAEREIEFREKIDLAMQLRTLRDAANLTQEQVAVRSGMSLETVQACEALTGVMPDQADVALYQAAVQTHPSSD
ncbi:helix-turn-helix domain-containing protein [Thioclava nitratireducens]|uniref:helix-turn-helix domain-containing protein n=1 Tax=Thioclava nitratireducens TaxID=1915078 RepID=UPI0024811693|nr:helix-turn-helix transcriptional regulator [Thioclava nitratireducens]WGT48650.1 helix-turn-helix transcriptional regulator [Thioclava nitratireducens]